MELNAYTENVSKLFSVQKQYVVPRFQRPYSWSKEQIKEFWEDIVSNIKYDLDKNEYTNDEYFIGTIVLVGDESSSDLKIVDGQQRLTTITILLSAMARRFNSIGEENISKSLYTNYVVGNDDNGEHYFKLQNENPKPFLQEMIQTIEVKEKYKPKSDEEKALQVSFNELYSFMDKSNIVKYLNITNNNIKLDNNSYIEVLKAVRDQLTKYVKIIRITVKEEEEAYTIFETLNARGINLTFVDLIKNTLFKSLKKTFPTDNAREKWTNILRNLQSRDGVGSMETYVRHWWISKYSVASESKLYSHFKKEFQSGNINAKEFIDNLNTESLTYLKICSPIQDDFKQQEEKQIYDSLIALKNFGVSQQRPFLLALFRSRHNKIVSLSDMKSILLFLEEFHFLFNAVCSQRPSGIEQTYSKASRDLNNSKNKRDANRVLNTLKEQLQTRIPEFSIFEEKLSDLYFLNNHTKHKKLIQYIFRKIESSKHTSREVIIGDFSLEHIMSQSTQNIAKETIGSLGNLIPLDKSLNEQCANKKFIDKKQIYQQSNLSLPKEIAEHPDSVWRKSDIDDRNKKIANLLYNEILSCNQ